MKNVAVIGGGNSAACDAIMLSEIAKTVFLIHRRDQFRAEPTVVEKLKTIENIKIITPANVTKLLGDETLQGIQIKREEKEETISVDGVFVAIGLIPALPPFQSNIELDEGGYANSDESCLTKTKGIFVAGDCRKKSVRQLTTAVSDGTVAAIAACEYINSL
jgi:thioredoxin reductase (NADPH)